MASIVKLYVKDNSANSDNSAPISAEVLWPVLIAETTDWLSMAAIIRLDALISDVTHNSLISLTSANNSR
jgi:hypothetical protein